MGKSLGYQWELFTSAMEIKLGIRKTTLQCEACGGEVDAREANIGELMDDSGAYTCKSCYKRVYWTMVKTWKKYGVRYYETIKGREVLKERFFYTRNGEERFENWLGTINKNYIRVMGRYFPEGYFSEGNNGA